MASPISSTVAASSFVKQNDDITTTSAGSAGYSAHSVNGTAPQSQKSPIARVTEWIERMLEASQQGTCAHEATQVALDMDGFTRDDGNFPSDWGAAAAVAKEGRDLLTQQENNVVALMIGTGWSQLHQKITALAWSPQD